ncbi:MAG TPA: nucleotidyl transferase AbiEii/AbiGii toxin family protein [Leptospiraceae bacterium]|nr:nucleotidyl transferase AbiEii/AbiGii toxin family protein [Leptospiraceae bacterium]HMW03757.1 nucleotidyl transferase AbiEii/AbiGii toxin family protein [Leptospiraceae bacterium]HMX31870.1 nucleotidyl transferase AbiEii/AbiGii toxin family protein [Leptospiraceae bacterium]HMY29737.1 nucleotidyl transferase AbiEii/AbiGii toxin family protein [Leptospiraceae bacterium]HMZ62864.1 nucleotidyl transferase AbiEii/AbiGii toxin family protein [Leptospiraceae bacterium]
MLKLATSEQRDFYEKKLYPMQDKIFSLLQSDKFYLTGGTCLSRFYYNHRYSDDLDFFFMGTDFRREDFEAEFREIQKRIHLSFNSKLEISSDYFKRLTVFENEQTLKVEFIYENFQMVQKPIRNDLIFLDTKENIFGNKLTAIHGRKTTKDYFDLFFLLKELKLSDGIKWSEFKHAPVDYEGAVLSLVGGQLEGDVFMMQEIKLDDFNEFQNNLITELLSYAKTVS